MGRIYRPRRDGRELVGSFGDQGRRFLLETPRNFRLHSGFPNGVSRFHDSDLVVGQFDRGNLVLDDARHYRLSTSHIFGQAHWLNDDEEGVSCVGFTGVEGGVAGSVSVYSEAPAIDIPDLVMHGLVALIYGEMRVWGDYGWRV